MERYGKPTLEDLGWEYDQEASLENYRVFTRGETEDGMNHKELLCIHLDKKKISYIVNGEDRFKEYPELSFAVLEAIRDYIIIEAIY